MRTEADKAGQDAGSALGSGFSTKAKEGVDSADLKGAGAVAGGDLAVGVEDGARPIATGLEEVASKGGGLFESALSGPLANVGRIFESTGGQMPGFVQKLLGVGGAMESAGGEAGIMGGAIGGIALPVVAAVAAVAVFTGASVEMAINFQTTTNQIAAAAGITTQAAASIGQAFLDTGGKSVYSGAQIARAFVDVAQEVRDLNGGTLTAAASMSVMNAAMNLAAGSGTNLDSATTDLVKIMRAYGESAGEAAASSDVLFQASRATGQTLDTVSAAFIKLHTQLGANTPPLQEMGGLLKDLYDHGEQGRGMTAALTVAMQNMVAPTAAAAAAQQAAGIAFETSSGQMLPMGEILDELQGKISGMSAAQATAELKTLGFGNASSKLVGIIQAGSGTLNADTASMLQHGSAADAATKANSGLGAEFKKVGASGQDLMTTLGSALLPALTELGRVVGSVLIFALQALETSVHQAEEAFHLLDDVLGPVVSGLESFGKTVGHVVSAVGGFFGGLIGLSGAHKTAGDAAKTHGAALDKLSGNSGSAQTAAESLTASYNKQAAQAGITGAQLQILAVTTGTSAASVVKSLDSSAATAGITGEAMFQLSQTTTTSMSDLGKAISSATTSANSSFKGSFDIVSSLGGQLNVTGTQIAAFYTSSVSQANTWTANIQTAIRKGYDPAVISQLITAGPAKAGPILQGMVSSTNTQLVGMVNAGAHALSTAGQQAVEQARLTQMAVSSSSSKYAADLSTAMAIDQQKMISGTASTVQGVAAALGVGVGQVQAVAQEYGIALPNAITSNIPKTGTAATGHVTAAMAGLAPGPGQAGVVGSAFGTSFSSGIDSQSATSNTSGTNLAQHSKTGLESIDAFPSGKKHGAAFASGVDNQQPTGNTSGTNLAQKTKSGLESVDATPSGHKHASAFITGVDNQQPAGQTSGQTLAQKTSDSAGKVDASPAGKSIGTSLISGINSKQSDVTSALEKVVSNAVDDAKTNAGGQSVGAAIDWGIEQGINANAGGINAAAAGVAQQAVASAKAAIGAHSPSTLAADEVGLPFVQGIALGITDNAELPGRALASVSAKLAGYSPKVPAIDVGVRGSQMAQHGSGTSAHGGVTVVLGPNSVVINAQGATADAAKTAISDGLAGMAKAIVVGIAPTRVGV